ncbi:hypothetical protein [Streptomyces sp. NBC_01497]|uniref:hypothetical protein n=1 Tax=Streptomyces sp. NBC_01497 TaxID=2903885 RepID=UPI002E2FEF0F|nr:hypothetical protein [Streptomyces sp. NBC_01497]
MTAPEVHGSGEEGRPAASLGERLRAVDGAITVPRGLWERVREAPDPAPPRRRFAARPAVLAGVAAVVVVVVAFGSWLLVRPDGARGPVPPAGSTPVTITVYNVERSCQGPRTADCALRVAVDPHARYAAPDNRAGAVWNGDRLTASCAVEGTAVRDEAGHASARWYRVRGPGGLTGWLPGVRTRDAGAVPDCV